MTNTFTTISSVLMAWSLVSGNFGQNGEMCWAFQATSTPHRTAGFGRYPTAPSAQNCRFLSSIVTEKLVSNGSWLLSSLQDFSDDSGSLYVEEGEADEDEMELSDEELLAASGGWDEKIARYNTISLTGRVGSITEPKYLEDGNKVVVNLSLASKRKYHNMERKFASMANSRDAIDEDATDWYGLEIWGPTAEFVTKYVDKGARVSVVGQLQIDSWTDKETGEMRYKAKVVVRDFDILESKAEADLRRNQQQLGGSTGTYSNKNNYNKSAKNNEQRGRSFYTDDDDDESGGRRPAGTDAFFG